MWLSKRGSASGGRAVRYGCSPILRRTGVNTAGLPRRLRHFVALLPRLAGRGKVGYHKTIAGLSANDNVGAWLPILWCLRAATFHRRCLTQQHHRRRQ